MKTVKPHPLTPLAEHANNKDATGSGEGTPLMFSQGGEMMQSSPSAKLLGFVYKETEEPEEPNEVYRTPSLVAIGLHRWGMKQSGQRSETGNGARPMCNIYALTLLFSCNIDETETTNKGKSPGPRYVRRL